MEEPYDFEEKGNNHLLCKLKNTLFEPSTKAMYTKFDSFIVSQNYIMTIGYHCQYVKYFSKGNFILFLLYVDDMLIVGEDVNMIHKFKVEQSKSFDMKDLGHAKHIFMCEKYLQ